MVVVVEMPITLKLRKNAKSRVKQKQTHLLLEPPHEPHHEPHHEPLHEPQHNL